MIRRGPGKMRHLAQIQKQPSMEQDSVGQRIDEWTAVATVWANIEPLNGREYFTAQQTVAEVTTRITTDYLPELTAVMRVVYDGVIYNIKDIIDVELRHRTHVLMCSSGVIANG